MLFCTLCTHYLMACSQCPDMAGTRVVLAAGDAGRSLGCPCLASPAAARVGVPRGVCAPGSGQACRREGVRSGERPGRRGCASLGERARDGDCGAGGCVRPEARGTVGAPRRTPRGSRSSGGASFAECLCLRLTPASAPESCGCSGLAEPLHAACLGHPETLLLHSCRLPGSCTRPSEVTGPRYSWKSCLELDP
ncbi:unnamed protein product [Rangifer tarandus platyrhynchus]|uniref:Uncharacterized protein n=1 Tax=Rangifer tarandus platyrhynchus TaxID=3082113 RepID=A0ABN8XT14_RANTA|nr:unnamed protein product [Rangifer tarandus platyrhynchus]